MEEELVPQVVAPEGITYQWVDVDPERPALKRRLDNGWTYVDPKSHRNILSERSDRVFIRGFVLMQKPAASFQPWEPFKVENELMHQNITELCPTEADTNSLINRLKRHQADVKAKVVIQDAIDEIVRLRKFRDLVGTMIVTSKAFSD